MRKFNNKTRIATCFLAFILIFSVFSVPAYGAGEEEAENMTGGGYAATGQVKNAGYTSVIYDATSGLPTSDANFILGASDGYVWIGGYSGIIRYDGTTFERLDT